MIDFEAAGSFDRQRAASSCHLFQFCIGIGLIALPAQLIDREEGFLTAPIKIGVGFVDMH